MGRGISPILLVEDDDILAGLLVEILGGLGEVVWSPSAEDAEARLGSQPWDLIVADVERAKTQTADRERLSDLGAAGLIAKPFDPMTLPDEVSARLAR